MNYYSEWNPFAAAWTRNLAGAGLIPPGKVDSRDMREVRSGDLEGCTQCHWFAGIGGWPLALRLAGFPADRPVWSASLPCQPWSVAGQRRGAEDDRHLWPAFAALVGECRPVLLVGEQVDSPDALEWLDGVRADLEALHYAFGAAVLPAACAGAPHARHRIFWCATRSDAPLGDASSEGLARRQGESGDDGRQFQAAERAGGAAGPWDDFDLVWCLDGGIRRVPSAESGILPVAHGVPSRRADPRLGYLLSRLEQLGHGPKAARRILADARANRTGRLQGIGNAIVPQVAAIWVRAVMEEFGIEPEVPR